MKLSADEREELERQLDYLSRIGEFEESRQTIRVVMDEIDDWLSAAHLQGMEQAATLFDGFTYGHYMHPSEVIRNAARVGVATGTVEPPRELGSTHAQQQPEPR